MQKKFKIKVFLLKIQFFLIIILSIIHYSKKNFIMTKEEKHAKANEFRNRITMPAQRKSTIQELLKKEQYSETDKICLPILFQKTSYIEGCESEYRLLILKLKGRTDLSLESKLNHFATKL